MIGLTFIARDGRRLAVQAEPGGTLLSLAQRHDQPLEGTCEGQMACATCHVRLDAATAARVPPASAAEEDMLDFAVGATSTSRLSCQLKLDLSLDGAEVTIP